MTFFILILKIKSSREEISRAYVIGENIESIMLFILKLPPLDKETIMRVDLNRYLIQKIIKTIKEILS